MSLIITSSKQDRYDEESMGVELPYAYQNHLQAPITIPANSEVAVQSVKCSRSPAFSFYEDQHRFYLHFGTAIVDGWNLDEYKATTPFRCDFKSATYDTKEMALQIKDALNETWGVINPDCAIASVVVKEAASVFDGFTIKLQQKLPSTKGDFANNSGFYPRPVLDETGREISSGTGATKGIPSFYKDLANIQSTNTNTKDPTFVPDWWDSSSSTISSVDGSLNDIVVTAGGFLNGTNYKILVPGTTDFTLIGAVDSNIGTEFVATGPGEGDGTANRSVAGETMVGGVFPQFPMSKQDGSFSWDPSVAQSVDWVVGLTRPVACGNAIPSDGSYDDAEGKFDLYGSGVASSVYPPWMYDSDAVGLEPGAGWDFCDYQVRSVKSPADGKHYLRVFYWGFRDGDFTDANPQNQLRWKQECRYWDNTTTQYPNLAGFVGNKGYCLEDDPDVLTELKFVISNEEVLLSGTFNGVQTTIIKVSGANSDNSNSLPNCGNPNKGLLYPKVFLQDITGSSLQITRFNGRSDMAVSGATQTRTWRYGDGFYNGHIGGVVGKDLDFRKFSDPKTNQTIPPVTTNTHSFLDYEVELILKKTATILPTYLTYPDANADNLLGFKGIETLQEKDGTAVNTIAERSITWGSTSLPTQDAAHSLFIRCPTLTHQSYNFGKGSMSKILYHLPQFDSTGRSVGALFYEPGEKTYLKLGNKEPITLNQLSIDIVDKNENYATEMDGTTVVVLHIKHD